MYINESIIVGLDQLLSTLHYTVEHNFYFSHRVQKLHTHIYIYIWGVDKRDVDYNYIDVLHRMYV